jgi:hypothetical protein
MSAFAYELAQLGLFVRARQFWLRRFEFEIERINHHLTNYKPSFEQNSENPNAVRRKSDLDVIDGLVPGRRHEQTRS